MCESENKERSGRLETEISFENSIWVGRFAPGLLRSESFGYIVITLGNLRSDPSDLSLSREYVYSLSTRSGERKMRVFLSGYFLFLIQFAPEISAVGKLGMLKRSRNQLSFDSL